MIHGIGLGVGGNMVSETRTSWLAGVSHHLFFYNLQRLLYVMQRFLWLFLDNLRFDEVHHGGSDEGNLLVPVFATV